MKLVAVVLALVGLGLAVYFGTALLASPERRTCERLSTLCGREHADRCVERLERLGQAAGPAAVEQTARCVQDSGSCAAAAGCLVGGIGQGVLGGFLDGLERSVGHQGRR